MSKKEKELIKKVNKLAKSFYDIAGNNILTEKLCRELAVDAYMKLKPSALNKALTNIQ